MANNTTLDPGAGGDTIATDDVTGVKYQRVKLVDGTEDSTAAIGGDAANGLDVDVTRVQGTVTVSGTVTASGPLTDTQLRATPVPVSGTVTATTGGLTDTQLRATPVPVSGTVSATATNAGTFATQDSQTTTDNGAFTDGTTKLFSAGYVFDEVAGTALTENDAAAARVNANRAQVGIIEDGATRARYATVTAANALKVDASGVAVPITDNSGSLTVDAPVGTPAFVRLSDGAAAITALPVTDNAGSLTVDAPVGTPAFVRLSDGAATLVGQKAMASSLPVAVASDQSALPVTQATLTKGTQGANGVSTQDLKDAGRVALQFYANGVASGTTTTETAITLTKAADTGATSSAVSFVITSGKRFRITSISVASRGNATGTAQITTFSLRMNTAGAVTTASTPIVFQAASACAATASAWDRVIIPIPDGYEILGNGTIQFGLTANAVFVTNAPTWFANITGFEY